VIHKVFEWETGKPHRASAMISHREPNIQEASRTVIQTEQQKDLELRNQERLNLDLLRISQIIMCELIDKTS